MIYTPTAKKINDLIEVTKKYDETYNFIILINLNNEELKNLNEQHKNVEFIKPNAADSNLCQQVICLDNEYNPFELVSILSKYNPNFEERKIYFKDLEITRNFSEMGRRKFQKNFGLYRGSATAVFPVKDLQKLITLNIPNGISRNIYFVAFMRNRFRHIRVYGKPTKQKKVSNFLKFNPKNPIDVNSLRESQTFWANVIMPVINNNFQNKDLMNFHGKLLLSSHTRKFSAVFLYLETILQKSEYSNWAALRHSLLWSRFDYLFPNVIRHIHVDPAGFEDEKLANPVDLKSFGSFRNILNAQEIRMIKPINLIQNPTLEYNALFKGIKKNSGDRLKKIHIGFLSDNYLDVVGGVQLYVGREIASFERNMETLYIALFPSQWSKSVQDEVLLSVLVRNEFIGEIRSRDLVTLVQQLKFDYQNAEIVLRFHALLGHSVRDIHCALKDSSVSKGIFFLHDFFSLCQSEKLLRNNYTFCHAPKVQSQSCHICSWGTQREMHSRVIMDMVHEPKVEVRSPSASTTKIWGEATDNRKEIRTIPHVKLLNPTQKNCYARGGILRIAFVGFPTHEKGWPFFLESFQVLNQLENVHFFHLGRNLVKLNHLQHIPLSQTSQDPNLTQRTLMENEIDIVCVHPRWPETYSFVTVEAIAAGCFVLTGTESGNVIDLAQSFNRQLLFDTPNEFNQAVMSGKIQEQLSRVDKISYDVVFNEA